MCHKPADCITCHEQKGIKWQPKDGWDYDPSVSDGSSRSGCLTCHGNATLLKSLGGGNKSFQVSGVEDSAHRDITCQQCHPDYRYDDKPAATKLWNVNAGIECGICHQDAERREEPRAGRALQRVDPRRADPRRQLRVGDLRFVPRRPLHPAPRQR